MRARVRGLKRTIRLKPAHTCRRTSTFRCGPRKALSIWRERCCHRRRRIRPPLVHDFISPVRQNLPRSLRLRDRSGGALLRSVGASELHRTASDTPGQPHKSLLLGARAVWSTASIGIVAALGRRRAGVPSVTRSAADALREDTRYR